jgi:hypothetical protein
MDCDFSGEVHDMDGRRLRIGGVLLLTLIVPACSHDNGESCVDASGVWTMSSVHEEGTVNCDAPAFTWTLLQNGCNLTIAAPPDDRANGASGVVTGSSLHVEWSYTIPGYENCLRDSAWITAAIAGDTVSGTYGLFRVHPVIPIPPGCPAAGSCTGALTGAR